MTLSRRRTPRSSSTRVSVTLIALAVLGCGSSGSSGTADSGSGSGTGSGTGRGTGTGSGTGGTRDSGVGSSDSGSHGDTGGSSNDSGNDSGQALHDAGPGADVCGFASGSVAWTSSISPTSTTLTITDIAVSQLGTGVAGTNDVVVADLSGTGTYEQHRWSSSGALEGSHQDAIGSYAGPFTPSALFMAADNDLFYGFLKTGLPQSGNLQASLVFTKLEPSGAIVFQTPTNATMPASDGNPTVTMFDSGGDSGGGLHGPLVMSGPQYFDPGVYCWSGTGSDEGPSAQTVTAMLTGHSYEWPMPSGNLAVATQVPAGSFNLGCSGGPLTVPSSGGIVLAQAGGGSGCVRNKLLTIPTAAVSAWDYRLGADSSSAFAVVYAGSLNFGNGMLTSTGTSSLALARFDDNDNLVWATSIGGTGASFTLGDVGVNSAGTLVVSAGYTGVVQLGDVTLPSTDNTLIAVFDSTGALSWSKTARVTSPGALRAAIGACGVVVATNSPSVDFGAGPLSSAGSPPTIGVAALGL